MRLVYTSDLHGHLDLYQAAGDEAECWEADALVLGGDLCPGTPSASSLQLPHTQPEFLLRELAPLLEQWRQRRPQRRVFAIPGNDDCETVIPALEELEARGLIENLHRAPKTLGDYTLVGLPFVPPTPFALKDFERWDSAAERRREPSITPCVRATEQGFERIGDFAAYLDSLPTLEEELALLPACDPDRSIAVIHCPPSQTHCDLLYDGRHIGSRALRRWIEARQPLLALHGHIHESPRLSGAFFDHIGRTTVVNPGCDHSRPHLVYIDLTDLRELRHSIYGARAENEIKR